MPKRKPQLYLMEPYDPNKEPLIMIHGLFDTPLAWAKLSNDLWADEKFREKYQIWHFLYNTSAPALYSGRVLRTQLRKLRPMLDPSGSDPAMKSTTVIAHSMGGIVTRSLITRPGQVFWDAAFTRPFESLKLGEADRSLLREAFFWEPEPHVRRVIYITVPHRGSNFADNFLGRIGRWLVEPPNKFAEFYARISSANPDAFTPAYAALGSGKLDSVHALSPRQPTLQILSRMPNSHRVATHSIIGNRGLEGPLKDSSDGVVEYWSSHLDHADSEKIVPSDHSAIDHPETVKEIRRILELP
jgi:pimeloyl-ACP methyl ester carboxylesterase